MRSSAEPGAWVLTIFTALMALSATLAGSFPARHLAFLGSNSLVILLLHGFLLNACKPLSGLILSLEPSGVLFAAIATAAGVYIPIACGWTSDQIRASAFVFGRWPITVRPG